MAARNILVLRHAESLEDIDNSVYELTPDHMIDLTKAGVLECEAVAKAVRGFQSCYKVFCSPALRALNTARILSKLLPGHVQVIADDRLRKQSWGSVTVHNREQILQRRYKAGVLRYRFPDGESGWDVWKRIGACLDELVRDTSAWNDDNNILVIITHGFGVRIAVSVLLGWSEQQFERLANPRNCFIARVSYDGTKYVLMNPLPEYVPVAGRHIDRVVLGP